MNCVNCDCVLGGKIMPFEVNDTSSDDAEVALKTSENWCPRCFCYKRALQSPERFYPGAFVPIRCSNCEVESVDHDHKRCLYCNSRAILALAPDPAVSYGDTGGRVKVVIGAKQ